jgi:CHAT domain-containing protein
MLTVAQIEKMDISSGYIAYLSACSTAEIGDGKLQDEAIHLANSLQTIGFPHVIGSLWSADDYAAGLIARGFYEGLASQTSVPQHDKVSKALHDSMLHYRSISPDNAARWGCFIHVGV